MNWELIGATGGWGAILATLVIYLHTRRTYIIDGLRSEIATERADNGVAHKAMAMQVSDLALLVANHYVRKDDLSAALHAITDQVVEARKEIGGINNRIDTLIRNVEWRRRAGDEA